MRASSGPGSRKRGIAGRFKRHGYTKKNPTYSSWMSMHARCYRPSVAPYPCYGGRGIKVCDRWSVFTDFLADMGERPEGTTLDRIDGDGHYEPGDGHYEPGNCRWATHKVQARVHVKVTAQDRAAISWLGSVYSGRRIARGIGLSFSTVCQVLREDR